MRFKNNDYFDMQDMLCQKYDVILTDYKTKREKVFSLLKNITLLPNSHHVGERPTPSTFFPRIIREFEDDDEPMIYGDNS